MIGRWMLRVRSKDAWSSAARSTAALGGITAAFMLLGALAAVVLEPPWSFVPNSFMKAIFVVDVVIGVLVAALSIHMLGVGRGVLPVATCSRADGGVRIAFTTGFEPLVRARAALATGHATFTHERRRNDREAGSTNLRIAQNSKTVSLTTPFAITDEVISAVIAFAIANGVEMEVSGGSAGP